MRRVWFCPDRNVLVAEPYCGPGQAALQCNNCHGTGGRMDWKTLGYEGEPQKIEGAARMSK